MGITQGGAMSDYIFYVTWVFLFFFGVSVPQSGQLFRKLDAMSTRTAEARADLANAGRALRNAQFRLAIDYLGHAKKLDQDLNIDLYLGFAYAELFSPNDKSDQNREFSDRAIENFERALKVHPDDTDVLANLGGLYEANAQIRQAREYYFKNFNVNPRSPMAAYSVANADYALVSNRREPLPSEEKSQLIAEGLQYLDKALSLAPDFDDAMIQKYLLFRQEGTIASEAKADEWATKASQTRKANQGRDLSLALIRDAQVEVPLAFHPGLLRIPLPPPYEQGQSALGVGFVGSVNGVASSPDRIRVAGTGMQQNLIYQPKVQYPPEALSARIQGTVRVETVILKDGTVVADSIRIISSPHISLNKAAIENVKQRRYKPTFLNGEAVSVITTIDVEFKLP